MGLPLAWYFGFAPKQGPAGLWWGLTAGLAAVAVLFLVRIGFRFRVEIEREAG